MRIHLLFPRDRVSQRSFVCQVAHNNHGVGVSAKQLRDASQPVLSSKVPKLEADRVTVNGENLERELTRNSRPVGGVEPVVDELLYERSLPRVDIAYNKNFEHFILFYFIISRS